MPNSKALLNCQTVKLYPNANCKALLKCKLLTVQCTATFNCHTQLSYQTISNITPTNCTISNQNTHVPNLNFNQSSSNRRLNWEVLWLELFNKIRHCGKVLYCRRHVDTHIWKAHRTRGHTKPGQRGTNNVHLLFQSAQTIKYSNSTCN